MIKRRLWLHHVDLHIAADWEKKNNDNISQTINNHYLK